MTPPSTFGYWLRQRRKMLDVTCEDLARRIGCAASTLYKIEADERRPSRQIAELLAQQLNIPPDALAEFIRFARSEGTEAAGTSFHAPTNMPAQPTVLIGRDDELIAIVRRLRHPGTRLLTLVGPPGTGKTRLALEVAARMLEDFADGVFLIALAPIGDARLVSDIIANTLGIPDIGPHTPLERLKVFLRDKRMLLVLDNFEQILAAAPDLAELMASAPSLSLLVTSRAPLRIRLERQFPVDPLTLPDLSHAFDLETIAQSAAVSLFLERAQAVKPDFALTSANAQAVAAICARLDGLPLAIELIAAQVKLLPPATLLDRLSGRLLLQVDSLRDLEPRHRTLHAAIEWSYQLLEEDEQRLFRRLGVFVGRWMLDGAAAVCLDDLSANVLDEMGALLDKSLIKQASGFENEPQFMMLEIIREFALERLAESGELTRLQEKHAIYFLSLVETPDTTLIERQMRRSTQLEVEQANFRAALSWSQGHADVSIGLRLMIALVDFWQLHGHLREGSRWFSELLAGHQDDAAPLPIEIRRLRAIAIDWLGLFSLWQGDLNAAQAHYKQSLVLFRELGDTAWTARCLSDFGMLFELRGDFAQARTFLDESLALFRDLDNGMGVAMCLFFLGTLAYTQGRIPQAAAHFVDSLSRFRLLDYPWMIAGVATNLGMVALDQGEYGRAEKYLTESLTVLQQMGEKWNIVQTIEGFARLKAELGQQQNDAQLVLQAAQLVGAAEALRQTLDIPAMEFQRYAQERVAASFRTQLDEETLAAAWAEGRKMSLDVAVAYALEGLSERGGDRD